MKDGETKIALEVDGFGKFKSRGDLDKFLNRQNYLSTHGWVLLRFSYTDVMETPHKTVALLRSYCAKLHIKNLLNCGDSSDGAESIFSSLAMEDPLVNAFAFVEYVNDYYRIQEYCARIFTDNHSEVITLQDNLGSKHPLVALSISTLYHYWDWVKPFVTKSFRMPQVRVIYEPGFIKRDIKLHPLIIPVEGQDKGEYVLSVNDLRASSQSRQAIHSRVENVDFRGGFTVENVLEETRPLVKEFFGHEETRDFQNRVLASHLNGEDVLGISATGSGKSLCFWIPTLLRPGLTIVISPLKSLMRDQKLSLTERGIANAAFLNSDMEVAEKNDVIRQVIAGNIRLLYVAPERLRIKSFLAQLATIQKIVPINCIAVDEAHCISEWGHEFRPSYLKLSQMVDVLRVQNPGLLLMALTATAGPMVKPDILSVLKLKNHNLIESDNTDREFFSYQVIQTEGDEEKDLALALLFRNDLSIALKRRNLNEVLTHKANGVEKSVGLIFCMYADPHGSGTVSGGISHYLQSAKRLLQDTPISITNKEDARSVYATGRVRAYCSKAPTLCPNCFSFNYVSYSRKQAVELELTIDEEEEEESLGLKKTWKLCLDCTKIFNAKQAEKIADWDQLIQSNQRDFKTSNFDVLVATKGFGMGIDKKSIRFVVHSAMPGGMESWYQEVGRAGRDGNHAHVTLLADLPNEQCVSEMSLAEIQHRPRCSFLSGCPHGKSSICDYGKQHIFTTGNYEGVEIDAKRALKVLAKITCTESNTQTFHFRSSQLNISKDEISLQRLSTLGLVNDYSVYYKSSPWFEVSLALDYNSNLDDLRHRLSCRLQEATKSDDRQSIFRLLVDKSIEDKIDNKLIQELVCNQSGLFESPHFWNSVQNSLHILLEYTYQNVLKMRYGMLWNLYDMASSKVCRRIKILGYFDKYEKDTYQCGMCDVCRPQLDYVGKRIAPTLDISIEEKNAQLNEYVNNDTFDLKALSALADSFKDYPSSRYIQAGRVLETSPDNLPAVYLSRKFSPPKEIVGNSMRLLDTANRRKVKVEDIAKLYDESPQLAKAKSIPSLNRAGSAVDSPEGFQFLEKITSECKGDSKQAADLNVYMNLFIASDNVDIELVDRISQKCERLKKVFYA